MAKRRKKYVKKDTRKRQIFDVIRSSEIPLTTGEVCRKLGVSYGPHMYSIFQELVAERWLQKKWVRLRGGLEGFVYSEYNPFGDIANDISKGA